MCVVGFYTIWDQEPLELGISALLGDKTTAVMKKTLMSGLVSGGGGGWTSYAGCSS